VRLNGLMSNKALLGLGWVHAALDDYERALVPWTELADRSTADTAVQESLLAVPFALGKLGAYRQSLANYERALDAYTREIARLDELRLAALERRIEADLERGRDAELIGELEALADKHPLRERLRGHLMLALYRAGRQADALEVYRAAREALVEELGIDPSPALQELERAILRALAKDPKTQLQELLQGRGQALPTYRVIATQGAAHRQSFEVECAVGELGLRAQGRGDSRRAAEQQAAEAMLRQLQA